MSAAPLPETGVTARNRRTARRLVSAVLVFHSLALFSGYLVLDHVVHAQAAAVSADTRAPALAGARRAPQTHVVVARSVETEWPAWVAASRDQDTPAPWRVDAQGHVHFDRETAR